MGILSRLKSLKWKWFPPKKYKGKKMPIFDLANAIANAIQVQEGYGTPAAKTITANNNPGAIRSWPGYPTVNGYAKFPDYQTGYDAIVKNTITNINKPNFTLADYITRYEGGSANVDKNNIPAYISNVSKQTGLPTDVPLSSLVDSSGVVAAASIDNSSESGNISVDYATIGLVALVGVGLLIVLS